MPKELPNSQKIEQALLGSLMVYSSVMSVCMELDLDAREFYLPAHERIYLCMQELYDSGHPIDLNNLITRLQDKEELERAGGADYIIQLMDSAVSPANTHSYIETIKNKAQMRELILAADTIAKNTYDSTEEIDVLLDEAERSIMDVTRHRRGTEFESSAQIVSRVIDDLNRLKTMSGVTGIRTGYADLDRYTNGFQRGDLIILAARPAMGKSALALNFASEVAKHNKDEAVAIFSLEMPTDSLMKRLLSAESEIQATKLRDASLENEEWSQLNQAGNRLSERKIFIDDTSSIKVSQIFSKCRKLKSEYGGISLIVIDYLQLITGTRADSRQQEVSDISRNLKILAKELDCPVIALSQLSREVEKRTDHRPQLADLRESGSIEQDADIVMFLYREKYYEREEDEGEKKDTELVDLTLAKHRNGGLGDIKLVFQKSISKFSSWDQTNRGDDMYAN
ncbi:replicative DNA helicase [Firmicutes bacterium M10-2]|nr:replicative DNA helicase [Firmicutes bacterium M10-2]